MNKRFNKQTVWGGNETNLFFVKPPAETQNTHVTLNEEMEEGVNEYFVTYKATPLNSLEAIEDVARPLTPLQGLQRVDELLRITSEAFLVRQLCDFIRAEKWEGMGAVNDLWS